MPRAQAISQLGAVSLFPNRAMHLCLSVVWQFVIALGYHILENVRPLGDPLGDHIPGRSVSLGYPWATTS